MLSIQFQNTLGVYALTTVDSSLLVEHLLHLERYRTFGTQAARMALEAAGQLDLLNLALERLAECFEDILVVLTQLFDLFLLVLAVQTEVCIRDGLEFLIVVLGEHLTQNSSMLSSMHSTS